MALTSTSIPSNIESLERSELIRLLKRVADERDKLRVEMVERVNKKAKTSTTSTTSTTLAPIFCSNNSTQGTTTTTTTPKKNPSFNMIATKKRIEKNTIRFVKKSAHNDKKKPWTEVTDSLPSSSSAVQLLEGHTPKSDTARMIKWELLGNDNIVNWLGLEEKFIHPVKFDGKVLCIAGGRPKIYAWAAFEKVEIKYIKNTGALEMKFRTYMARTGNPACFDD